MPESKVSELWSRSGAGLPVKLSDRIDDVVRGGRIAAQRQSEGEFVERGAGISVGFERQAGRDGVDADGGGEFDGGEAGERPECGFGERTF